MSNGRFGFGFRQNPNRICSLNVVMHVHQFMHAAEMDHSIADSLADGEKKLSS